jgi:hypothetical protein
MPDFGFVGGAYAAQSRTQDAQELINWYCEVDMTKQGEAYYQALGMQESRGVVALYPTPGYTLQCQLQGGEVRAMRTLTGGDILLAVCGHNLYSMTASMQATIVGTLLSANGIVSISDNGIAAYIVDGENRYSYVMATGVFSVIAATDGGFTGASKVDICDNYFVYNRPRSAQFGCTNALSTVSPQLSLASKFGASDNIQTLFVTSRNVYLLGEITSEAWIDVGAFPFPFQIIPGTTIQHGCAAPFSVAKFGDTFAMLAQDQNGQGFVVMAEGYNFVRISTHAVEWTLENQVINDAVGFSYTLGGHQFYVLTFPTIDTTWAFDLATGQWHKWLSMDSQGNFHRHRANCAAVFRGLSLIGDYSNGAISALSNFVYTENGNTIKRLRRAPHITNDLKRMFYHSFQVQFQPGVGLNSGQGQLPQAMLRWSDDGGFTWSSYFTKYIGAAGQYKNRAIWRRLGQARDRVFEVIVTDPVNAVIVSANLEAEPGAT